MTVVRMAFDVPLTVAVDVQSGELRFELGDVVEPSAPTVVELEGRVAVTEGLLDLEDKQLLDDARVERAFALLAGETHDGEPPWDWSEGVADAANASLARLVKQR